MDFLPLKSYLKKRGGVFAEMAGQVRALAILAEDLSSVPSTHMTAYNHL